MAALLCCAGVVPAVFAKTPVEYANPLVGTASLDDPALLGNAPPPGEEAYTGFTYPGPALPHRNSLLGPINKDLTEAAGNHGIIFPYIHSRHTMIGFSGPGPGLTIMPVVGNWTVPPDRSYASPHDKSTETASPGYYSVKFPDSGIRTELTTTERIGYYRFTFPKTERGAVLIDLGAGENSIEIVGDHIVRGRGGRGDFGGRCFVAEFSCRSNPLEDFVKTNRDSMARACEETTLRIPARVPNPAAMPGLIFNSPLRTVSRSLFVLPRGAPLKPLRNNSRRRRAVSMRSIRALKMPGVKS